MYDILTSLLPNRQLSQLYQICLTKYLADIKFIYKSMMFMNLRFIQYTWAPATYQVVLFEVQPWPKQLQILEPCSTPSGSDQQPTWSSKQNDRSKNGQWVSSMDTCALDLRRGTKKLEGLIVFRHFQSCAIRPQQGAVLMPLGNHSYPMISPSSSKSLKIWSELILIGWRMGGCLWVCVLKDIGNVSVTSGTTSGSLVHSLPRVNRSSWPPQGPRTFIWLLVSNTQVMIVGHQI